MAMCVVKLWSLAARDDRIPVPNWMGSVKSAPCWV